MTGKKVKVTESQSYVEAALKNESTTDRAKNGMSEREMNATTITHISNEFTNAWAHYRHNENMRIQYLQYFITISLALFSGIGYLLLNKGDDEYILLIEIIFYIYSIISMFIHQSIEKMNNVLRSCELVFEKIRRIFIGDEMSQLISHRTYLKNMDIENDKLLSISRASENIICFLVILSFFVLLIIDILKGIFCNWNSCVCFSVIIIKTLEMIIIFNLFKSKIRSLKKRR